VSGSVNFDNYPERPVTLLPGEIIGMPEEEFVEVSFGTDFDLLASITLDQLIFDGQYIVALRAAREYRQLRKNEYLEQMRNAKEDIMKSFLRVILEKEIADILQENIATIEETLEETKLMYENGFVERLDLDRIRLQLNRVRTQHDDAVRRYNNSLQMLKLVMGYPVAEDLQVTGDLEHYREALEVAEALSFEVAFSRRIERDILRSMEAVTLLDRRRHKAGYLPTLSGYASYRQNAQRNEFTFFEADQDWFPMAVVGLRLNVPIFDGFLKNAKIEQKSLELRQIEEQHNFLEQMVLAELSETSANLESAMERITNESENVRLAETIYDQMLERYREGIAGSRDVTDAQNDLNQAQIDYLNALLELLYAEIDLKIANGTL
jgi:outer membrane protein